MIDDFAILFFSTSTVLKLTIGAPLSLNDRIFGLFELTAETLIYSFEFDLSYLLTKTVLSLVSLERSWYLIWSICMLLETLGP